MSTFFHVLLFSLPFVWIGCLIRLGYAHPKATMRISLYIAFIGGVLGGVLGKELGMGAYGGFFPPLIGIIAVHMVEKARKAWLKRLVANALDLRNYALRVFDELDADRNGDITRMDLEDFREKHREHLLAGASYGTGSPEALLFHQLDHNLSVIGHVVSSHIAVMPTPMGGAHCIETYGISRADLESWPTRVSCMLVDEFGSEKEIAVS
jgi:hypothetical protein